MWIINLPEGAGSCSCYNPPILLFLEKELPQNRKKPAFELNQKQVSFVEGPVEIDILDGRNRCRRTAKRPFWAAARVRRTSVLAVGQNLGAGVAPPPRALKSRRVEPPCGRRNPQKRTSAKQMSFFVSFVAEKDTARKALRLKGFRVLRNLYFCFSALFSSHFRTPILTY